ncbi:porin [Niveibacterium terrae]|uniref:porin n=1 Tax=Niveibacterium terrae TaxID=3373598 RepID=UPI003A914B5E
MQKKLMAAVISGLLTAPVFAADTSVTLYGLLDAGYSARWDNYNASVSGRKSIDSGIANGSRIGVRGFEQIEPGVKAFFVIEGGINGDTGASKDGLAWSRQTLVGLDTQGYKLAVGRQLTPIYNNYSIVDPFGLGMVGQSSNVFKHIDARASNAVTISTPVFAKGFAVDTIYSTNKAVGSDEALANTGDDRYFSIFPKYSFGKSTVFAGYTQDKIKNAEHKKQYFDVMGSLDLDVATLSLAYARVQDGTSQVNGEDKKWDRFLVGAKVPYGNLTGLVSFNYSKDKNGLNEKVAQYALGGAYAFSKRTDIYVAYAQEVTSDGVDAAAAKVTDSTKYAYTVGDGSNNGLGYRRGLNLGLRHRF